MNLTTQELKKLSNYIKSLRQGYIMSISQKINYEVEQVYSYDINTTYGLIGRILDLNNYKLTNDREKIDKQKLNKKPKSFEDYFNENEKRNSKPLPNIESSAQKLREDISKFCSDNMDKTIAD